MPPNSLLSLSKWQAAQVAMLYYFTSLEFLYSLHGLVTKFIDGSVDPVLDLAKEQERDTLLSDPVWGTRRTSENWANYAWPMLKDLQVALAKTISARQAARFHRPGVVEHLRGVEQFSLEWTTPDEEHAFGEALALIGRLGTCWDDIFAHDEKSRLNDFNLTLNHDEFFAASHDRIPKFKIRQDICALTGEVPPRTGVYIAADDPHATPQFAFCEGQGRSLREANTFTEIGLAALAYVGRRDLWRNDAKMLEFAKLPRYAALFHDEIVIEGEEYEEVASEVVADVAFTSHPATWFFVEPVEGEFDNMDDGDEQAAQSPQPVHRIVGGESCVVAGYYFTPAMPGARRYFSSGELTPAFDAKYGHTFWQWDTNQERGN